MVSTLKVKMTNLKKISIILVISACSFLIGKYSTRPAIEIKEVEKTVFKERIDISRNVNKKEVIKPDGTRIIEISSITNQRSDTSIHKELSKDQKTTSRPDWRINLIYQPKIDVLQDQVVTADIQHRLFSEVYIGAFVTSQKTVGVSLGIGI